MAAGRSIHLDCNVVSAHNASSIRLDILTGEV